MLHSEIIKHNFSPSASPEVLACKPDGIYQLHIDYWSLNQNKIKDNFPIPLIDGLLGELNGDKHLLKWDVRFGTFGYHQVQVVRDDKKTTFRTYQGHYEFLVIYFGLTNAPSTFQKLINNIFKPTQASLF